MKGLTKNLNATGSDIRHRLAAILPALFPNDAKNKRTKRSIKNTNTTGGSKKERRRRLYKEIQKDWKKNPGRIANKILGHNIEATNMPPRKHMVHFWQNVVKTSTHSTPGYTEPATTHHTLLAPVTLAEAENSYPSTGSAPGPDMITTGDVKALGVRELAIILNTIMICDRPPNCMLESRTRLIPKKTDAPLPGDYRPITVSSVILRCLHKILARRVTTTIPINEEQTALRPAD